VDNDWRFALGLDSRLDVLSGKPGRALSELRLLRTGMENPYRIEFSRNGRFLFAQTHAGLGRVSARIWDIGDSSEESDASAITWKNAVGKAVREEHLLRQLVCHVASIEGPQGDQLSPEELRTWGINTQPCPKPGPEQPPLPNPSVR
jgi:hypothetical protein